MIVVMMTTTMMIMMMIIIQNSLRIQNAYARNQSFMPY